MKANVPDNAIDKFVLEEFLPYRLSLLSNTVSQGISAAYRADHGLSVIEWRVLAILGRFPGLTASEVMKRGVMDKVAVSRAVKKLQEKELVERRPHENDRRRQPLKLTPGRGVPLFRQVVPKALSYERDLLSALNDDELYRLGRILHKLQSRADQLNGAQS